jgi:hypothetical protein
VGAADKAVLNEVFKIIFKKNLLTLLAKYGRILAQEHALS